jgi:hypothetical protein
MRSNRPGRMLGMVLPGSPTEAALRWKLSGTLR